MLLAILVILSVIMLIASILPITHLSHWVVRGLDFPRLQLAVLSLLISISCLIALVIDGDIKYSFLIIINLLVFCYQMKWIFVYTCLYPKEVNGFDKRKNASRIRILSSNVLMPNKNSDSLIRLIKVNKPDIVVTLETNQWWQDKLSVLEEEFPYSIKCPLNNLYGMHVYSRFEFIKSEVNFLIDTDVPSMFAIIELNKHEIELHFLHPKPPSPTESETSQDRDSELIFVANNIANLKTPVIVTGDLNDVAWSKSTHLFRHISGLKDPRIGRGMFNTFHASYWILRWPLDHLFHSDHFYLVKIKRLKLKGSDHFSLFTELALPLPSSIDECDTQPEALTNDEEALVKQRKQEQQAKP